MTTPADFARVYAQLFTWLWDGDDWVARRAPVINYLQHNDSKQDRRAQEAHKRLRALLPRATGMASVNQVKTFNYNDYDYINNSISRSFMGKACPWEIQETLQLASEVGAVTEGGLLEYCRSSLGVDCGGFVANYWGEACPHMGEVAPAGWSGILPRGFWSNTSIFPGVMASRRRRVEDVKPGDAAVFFKDVKDNNPDVAKQRRADGSLIAGSGSEAFHIALVNRVGGGGGKFTLLEVAESAGSPSLYGGDGVNVHPVTITDTGTSGTSIYCQSGPATRLYFVGPPPGWGPETAYSIA